MGNPTSHSQHHLVQCLFACQCVFIGYVCVTSSTERIARRSTRLTCLIGWSQTVHICLPWRTCYGSAHQLTQLIIDDNTTVRINIEFLTFIFPTQPHCAYRSRPVLREKPTVLQGGLVNRNTVLRKEVRQIFQLSQKAVLTGAAAFYPVILKSMTHSTSNRFRLSQ